MLRVGDLVEVRSRDEILATLDQDGRLDGMPFMPEMFAFCGKQFPVYKSAHKTCDTVFPVRSRRLDNVVHLDLRCDGAAHGGCQAGCLLFWKHAWLKPAGPRTQPSPASEGVASAAPPSGPGCTEETVRRRTRVDGVDDANDPTYQCQATCLPYASMPLSAWDPRQYVQDLTSRNVGVGQWLRGLLYITYQNLINLGIGWGPALRWIYERFQALWGGLPYPRRLGRIPMGESTPAANLDLQVGEMVRVKSYEEILATCNVDNKNRGMGFDGEQMPFCGGTYRVLKRVDTIINEKTGKMMHMKNPCIILEGVFCQGRYSECRMFCSRAIYSYWREIWLTRVEPGGGNKPAAPVRAPARIRSES
jgi:hypothetical protein